MDPTSAFRLPAVFLSLNAAVYAAMAVGATVTAAERWYAAFQTFVLYVVGAVDVLAACGFLVYGLRVAVFISSINSDAGPNCSPNSLPNCSPNSRSHSDHAVFPRRYSALDLDRKPSASASASALSPAQRKLMRRVLLVCALCTLVFLFRGVYSLLVSTHALPSYYGDGRLSNYSFDVLFFAATEWVPSVCVMFLTLSRGAEAEAEAEAGEGEDGGFGPRGEYSAVAAADGGDPSQSPADPQSRGRTRGDSFDLTAPYQPYQYAHSDAHSTSDGRGQGQGYGHGQGQGEVFSYAYEGDEVGALHRDYLAVEGTHVHVHTQGMADAHPRSGDRISLSASDYLSSPAAAAAVRRSPAPAPDRYDSPFYLRGDHSRSPAPARTPPIPLLRTYSSLN